MADFPSEIVETLKLDIFKMLERKKKCQPSIQYPEELVFKLKVNYFQINKDCENPCC